ncbi:MAG: recombinase [Cyanobacteriota bacterium]|jgi:site-specific recombinase XerD
MTNPDAEAPAEVAGLDEEGKAREAIREENAKLLEQFKTWLEASGTSASTARKHRGNLEFYLNHFLLNNALTAADGVNQVGEFLGWWFIHKAMWASRSSIKSNATSLKSFYTFLVEEGIVKPEGLDALKQQIKAEMPDWLEELERFDNPDVDFDDL